MGLVIVMCYKLDIFNKICIFENLYLDFKVFSRVMVVDLEINIKGYD